MANQRLNATITIGGAMAASLGKAVGAVNAKLGSIGDTFRPGGVVRAQARIGAAIDANNIALDRARGQLFDAVGSYYALKGALGAPIGAAMQFESAMADVKKVVDFENAADLAAFQDGLLDLTRTIPMAVDGLAEIAAAAGQAGIAKDEILKFTESAARIGTAFDISAGQAGDALAKLMTGLGISLGEAVKLTDAMNHLSNSQASTAAEILDVVQRTAAMGAQYGFSAEQIAALGSAMIASGAQSDVAATSFLNMGRALTRGTSATKRQQGAYKKLGLEAEDVARRMQEDAAGTTIEVLEAISKLPAEMRAAVSSDLFGDEARALGPLMTNLDLLRESLGMVSDESQYAGSAFKEAAARSKTFQNRMILFNNALGRVAIRIGEALIPAVTSLIEAIEPAVEWVGQWVDRNPELVAGIVMATGALVAFKGALAAIRFVGLLGKGGALDLLAFGLNTIGRAGGRLGGAAREAIALQAALGRMDGKSLTTLQKLGTGLRGAVMAVPGVGLLGQGIMAIGSAIATISAPVWGLFAVAAAAVGAAGYTIWKYWDRLSSTFSGVTSRIGEELQPVLKKLQPMLDWFAPIGETIAAGWDKAKAAMSGFWDWIGSFFEQETLTDEQKAQYEQAGYDLADRVITGIKSIPAAIIGLGQEMIAAGKTLMQSVWDGFTAKFDEFIAWVKGIPGQIVAAIGNIDLSSIIKWPSPPAWWTRLTGGEDAPARGGASGDWGGGPVVGKATGGLFRAGPLVVGERGPELRFEDRAGFIATARQTANLQRAVESIRAGTVGALGDRARAGVARAKQVINGGLGGITIYAPPGASPSEIAEEVMRRIDRRSRAALYDGVQA